MLEKNNNDNTICLVCKMFCHAGHTVVLASHNLKIKSFCDCGSGGFEDFSRLNNRNPFSELKEIKGCSVVHPTFEMILQSSKDTYGSKILKSTSFKYLSEYTTRQFLTDLEKAFKLPSYFEGNSELSKKLEYEKIMKQRDGIFNFKDPETNSSNCLAKNLILLANGIPTNSFISFFGVKRNVYTLEDYNNQDPFSKKMKNESSSKKNL